MGAVGERESHRLGDEVDELGRVGCHRGQVERLEDVQNLRHVHTAGTGRREADDLVSAIGRPHRFASPGLVVGEVVSCHQSAVVAHPLLGLQRERATVKPVAGMTRDLAVRPGQVRLPQSVTAWPGIAFGVEKYFCTAGKLAQFFHHLAKPAQIGIVEFKSLLGNRCRLAKVLGEIDVAVFTDRKIVRG